MRRWHDEGKFLLAVLVATAQGGQHLTILIPGIEIARTVTTATRHGRHKSDHHLNNNKGDCDDKYVTNYTCNDSAIDNGSCSSGVGRGSSGYNVDSDGDYDVDNIDDTGGGGDENDSADDTHDCQQQQ